MDQKEMTTEEKGRLIGCIVSALRFQASIEKKAFDAGAVFLSLCFKTDDELRTITRLCGI